MKSGNGWLGGLLLVILFIVAMASCQGDNDGCSNPADEYEYQQCQEMRP